MVCKRARRLWALRDPAWVWHKHGAALVSPTIVSDTRLTQGAGSSRAVRLE